jgi:hypothetical protein
MPALRGVSYAYPSFLKVKAVRSSETSVKFYQITRHNIPEVSVYISGRWSVRISVEISVILTDLLGLSQSIHANTST